MKDYHHTQYITANNEESLKTLVRAIELNKNEFSLFFIHCNYSILRRYVLRQLRQLCPVKIRNIYLQQSTNTLYSSLIQELGEENPKALMIFGLESLKNIDNILTSANHIREEFAKKFNCPIFIWVNDFIANKFTKIAPDFSNWSISIDFSLKNTDLIQFLDSKTKKIFTNSVNLPSDIFQKFFSKNYLEVLIGFDNLQKGGNTLQSDIIARRDFIDGLKYYYLVDNKNHLDIAINCYNSSLNFWRTHHDWKFRGIVYLYIALAYFKKAENDDYTNQNFLDNAKNYLQLSIDSFNQFNEGKELVAKYITLLCKILRHLKDWEELEKIANYSCELHKNVVYSLQLAEDYSFLAESLLEQQKWNKSREKAEKSLEILINKIADKRPNLRCQHPRYTLALAEEKLNNISEVISILEKAKLEINRQYDPQGYSNILNKLSKLYFQEEKFLEAVQIKQKLINFEQQYGLRPFIGITSLNPVKYSRDNITENILDNPVPVRQKEIKELIKRIKSTHCKLIIIHGQSGVGKSSLLRGGLVPALKKESINGTPISPIFNQRYTDWLEIFKESLTETLKEQISSYKDVIKLFDDKPDHKIKVLIFDQFEELFILEGTGKYEQKRQEFYDFILQCLQLNSVKLIISIREDYLHNLLALERTATTRRIKSSADAIKNILCRDNRYELGNWSRAEAEEVIRCLTRCSSFKIIDSLLKEVVNDLALDFDRVRPIELQIVGAQLYKHQIKTADEYINFGKKKALVQSFLEEVIEDCGQANQRAAGFILYLLIGKNDTRTIKTKNELAKDLEAADFESEISKLNLVLQILVASGLVSEINENSIKHYQLVHDYLVFYIGELQQAQQLQEKKKQIDEHKRQLEKLNQELTNKLEQEVQLKKGLEEGKQLLEEGQKQLESKNSQLEKQQKQLERQSEKSKKNNIILILLLGISAPVAIVVTLLLLFAQLQEIYGISKTAQALYTSNQKFEALKEGIKAGKKLREFPGKILVYLNKDIEPQVKLALQQPVYWLVERNHIEAHEGLIWGVAYSPKMDKIASASFDNKVKVWNPDGSEIKIISQLQEEHKDKVLAVNFSSDGKIIASGDFEGKIKLWRWDDKHKQFKYLRDLVDINDFNNKAHEKGVYSISFSSDGKLIATGSRDGNIKLWKQHSQDQYKFHQTVEKAHDGKGVNSIDFSNDLTKIATAGRDNTVKLWNLSNKNKIDSNPFQTLGQTGEGKFTDYVWTVAWSPDDSKLVTAARDKTVKIWSKEGKFIRTFYDSRDDKKYSHAGRVMSASFSPDGKIIASASQDNSIKLWKEDGTLLANLNGHTNGVYDVSFLKDGKTLVSAGADLSLRIWQLNNDKTQCNEGNTYNCGRLGNGIVSTLNSHSGLVRKVSFDNSNFDNTTFNKNNLIATASFDNTVKLWNKNGSLIKTLKDHTDEVNSVAFSPKEPIIASGGSDKKLILWSKNGKFIKYLKTPINKTLDKIMDVSFSPQGDIIAAATVDNTIILWKKNGNGGFETLSSQLLSGHRDWARSISWSTDGKIIASASDDKTIKLWRKDKNNNFQLLQTLSGENGHKSWVYSVSISPDNQLIASSGNDKKIILWKLDKKDNKYKYLKKLQQHNDEVNSIIFSPDGKMIATASSDKTVKLWKKNNNGDFEDKSHKTLTGHQSELYSVSFSADSKILAIASEDSTAILWDLDQLEELNSVDNLLQHGCEWLSDYFKNNSKISSDDKNNCQ
jgi:WD40 repeat protein